MSYNAIQYSGVRYGGYGNSSLEIELQKIKNFQVNNNNDLVTWFNTVWNALIWEAQNNVAESSFMNGRFDKIRARTGGFDIPFIAETMVKTGEFAKTVNAPKTAAAITESALWFHCKHEEPNSSYCQKGSANMTLKEKEQAFNAMLPFYQKRWFIPTVAGVSALALIGGIIWYKKTR